MGIIMQDFLNDIPLLVEVARQRSFSKAAEKLGIGVSTLSRRIKLLEKKMGVLLFYRDTRNVEPTDNGVYLLDRCSFVLEEVQRSYDSVIMNMQKPDAATTSFIPGAVDEATLKYAIQKARGG